LKTSLKHPVFKAVQRASEILGQESYVVGGFVRDQILGRDSKDVDFVTVGNGIKLAQKVAELLGKSGKINVFKRFGTAQFVHDSWDFEFVGARKESYRENSRKPSVENGSLEDDQNRRDFTINALAISLNEENYGTLLDPFDGLADIENKIIRTPLDPEITFSDDPLRMMRAIRFASQLEFKIDDKTLKGIEKVAHRISIISMERVSDELNKIILASNPATGFKLLDKVGILPIIFPEFCNLKGAETRNGIGHKDNFYHTLQVLDNISLLSDNLWLRWSAILHDIAKPQTKRFSDKEGWTFHGHEHRGSRMVKGIFNRFKLPLNEKMKYVEKMVLLHLRPIVLSKEIVTDSAVRRLLFDAGDATEDLLNLCRADITSKNERKVKKFLSNLDVVEEKIELVEQKDSIRNFQPPVNGEEIMGLFNIKPSREVGIIKNALKDAVLDGEIENIYDEAITFVKRKGLELGLTLKQ
jgi:poly(A) polymerase